MQNNPQNPAYIYHPLFGFVPHDSQPKPYLVNKDPIDEAESAEELVGAALLLDCKIVSGKRK